MQHVTCVQKSFGIYNKAQNSAGKFPVGCQVILQGKLEKLRSEPNL